MALPKLTGIGGPLLHAKAGEVVPASGQPILVTVHLYDLPDLRWAAAIGIVAHVFPHSASGQDFLAAEVFALATDSGKDFSSLKTFRLDTAGQPYANTMDRDIERALKMEFFKV